MSFRTALVTGAAKGIGREIARQLANRGFHVFLTARDEEAGKRTALEIRQAMSHTPHRGEVDFLHLDVTEPKTIQWAAAEFSNKATDLDVLVNNAAVMIDKGD